jgi:NAD(P)-dependent dehydrogenase (short-subunit alcohol dehydrogenase family)
MKQGKAITADGPFAETKEELAGYDIVEAKGPDEAIAIAARVQETPLVALSQTASVQETFGLHANGAGMTRAEIQASIEGTTLLRRLPTLAEVANVAAFMASDRASASAMTGTVANMSCGSLLDQGMIKRERTR